MRGGLPRFLGMTMHSVLRTTARSLAVAAMALVLVAPAVDAKVGGGSSMGSRGGRTFSAPPSTATAPKGATPMQRTDTSPSVGQTAPGSMAGAAAGQRRPGFGTGMMAGLLGAGILGMLMGGGFFGGLSGLGSMLGLLMQVALIGGLIWLALRFFRRRSEPAMATAGAGQTYGRSALGGMPGAVPGGGSARVAPEAPVQIGPSDYAEFERALVEIQNAYGREDMNALSHKATPEMVRYFGSDLEADRSKGLVNRVSDAKLLQGDLAEAWREGAAEYATVAMRFTVVDSTVERATGRVVAGNPTEPTQSVEHWTFRREAGGAWLLSAIQQAG